MAEHDEEDMRETEGGTVVDPHRLHEAARIAEALVFASAGPVSSAYIAERLPRGVDVLHVMRALKGRNIRWQAGVTSKLAQDDAMLELAAASGCTMLSIGFESISRDTLKSVHKHVNRPEQFAALVEKVHSYGIAVFGLFMFGFDGDDTETFQDTARFNIDANYDAVAYSVLTPYPGTLTWYEMKKENRIVSFDWEKYDQANVVYRPKQMTGEELRLGHNGAYDTFYAMSSIARRL